MKNSTKNRNVSALLFTGAFLLAAGSSWAAPLTNTLYAKPVWINPTTGSADNVQGSPGLGRIPMWGFATTPGGVATVPGPKIQVTESQVADGLVLIVSNSLPEAVSVVIPGLNGSVNIGSPVRFPETDVNYSNRVRSLVAEVAPGTTGEYRWNGPLKLGTYGYHSGSHIALQVQMGLYGMVTVRSNSNQVYPGYAVPATRDTSVIFSEVDPVLHWAVQTNDYGPGKDISSTIHSKPGLFLINGRTYGLTAPSLTGNGARNQQSLFRMVNFCWNSHVPGLVGPTPTGNSALPSGQGHYLTAIAEDGNLYPYPHSTYAPNLTAMKSMDFLFTPPNPGGPPVPVNYMLYDQRFGLSNPADPDGGMYAKWIVGAF